MDSCRNLMNAKRNTDLWPRSGSCGTSSNSRSGSIQRKRREFGKVVWNEGRHPGSIEFSAEQHTITQTQTTTATITRRKLGQAHVHKHTQKYSFLTDFWFRLHPLWGASGACPNDNNKQQQQLQQHAAWVLYYNIWCRQMLDAAIMC